MFYRRSTFLEILILKGAYHIEGMFAEFMEH